MDKRKTQNIITIVVGCLALVLAGVVILVKTGVINTSNFTTTAEMVTESTIITVAQTDTNGEEITDENGDVVYYTMVDYYTKPSHSSNHKYPTTTTKEAVTTTTEKEYYIEVSSVEAQTDENGEAVTDADGKAVTKIVSKTKKTDENGNVIENGTTAEPTTVTTSQQTTSIVYKTDPISKKPIKNIKGEYITAGIVTEAPTTTTTTTKPVVHVKGETTTKKKTTTKKTTTTTSTTGSTVSVTETTIADDTTVTTVPDDTTESATLADTQ